MLPSAVRSGGPGREKISPSSAKYASKPPGTISSRIRAGLSVGFQNACGTARGFSTRSPSLASNASPPTSNPTVPSRRKEYSSSFVCVCTSEPSARGRKRMLDQREGVVARVATEEKKGPERPFHERLAIAGAPKVGPGRCHHDFPFCVREVHVIMPRRRRGEA